MTLRCVVSCCAVLMLSLAMASSCGAQQGPSETAPSALRGKILFLRCASCHDLTAGGVDRIGPSLRGVVGRKAGSLDGFPYSPAMKAAAFVWDRQTLNRWLERPESVVPGTAMAFAGLANEEDRQTLIGYLENPGD